MCVCARRWAWTWCRRCGSAAWEGVVKWGTRAERERQLALTEQPLWALGRVKTQILQARELSGDERIRAMLDAAIREADEAQRVIAAWDGYRYRRMR